VSTWRFAALTSSACFPSTGRVASTSAEPWQEEIVEAAPWPFIRGCIRTDGCCFINRTDVHRPQPYEYRTYEFANVSTDIADLFRGACRRVGVFTRANRDRRNRWSVRINRRDSVELMLEHVGLKE